jgi:hypothetical protein|tara:strand:+ start:1903 stop:2160 length:258 start_codon:yes stop_codon:yes gene_type:complete
MESEIGAAIAIIKAKNFRMKNASSPKDADPNELWAHLKVKYKDGDEMVDESGGIWDVWRKGTGYILYCGETKETLEIPQPKKLGG